MTTSKANDLSPLSLLPSVTAKLNLGGEWKMSKSKIQQALIEKEITKKIYIKWAIIFDYGEITSTLVDVKSIVDNWSFSAFNKITKKSIYIDLTVAQVLQAIAALAEDDQFRILPQQIQLRLDLYQTDKFWSLAANTKEEDQ